MTTPKSTNPTPPLASVPCDDLLACPWCGPEYRNQLRVTGTGSPKRPRKNIWCPMCNVVGPEGISDASAAEQWNKRWDQANR